MNATDHTGKPRPDQRADDAARLAVDQVDRAADSGRRDARAIRRDRERDDRRRAGLHLADLLAASA